MGRCRAVLSRAAHVLVVLVDHLDEFLIFRRQQGLLHDFFTLNFIFVVDLRFRLTGDAGVQVQANATLLNELLKILIELLFHGRDFFVDLVIGRLLRCRSLLHGLVHVHLGCRVLMLKIARLFLRNLLLQYHLLTNMILLRFLVTLLLVLILGFLHLVYLVLDALYLELHGLLALSKRLLTVVTFTIIRRQLIVLFLLFIILFIILLL